MEIAEDFWKIWNFPNCMGSIDGKHVEIIAPPNCGSLFYNYKKHYSIILMAAVDAKYLFTYVDIGAYGHCSDSTVFMESTFGKTISDMTICAPDENFLPETSMKSPFVFIGDEGFPLKPNIMRPYPRRQLDREKRIFNYRLSRARRTVENVFGILSARWRILRRPIEAYTAVDEIVKATACLHNYLKSTDFKETSKRQYVPPNFIDRDGDDGNIIPGEWRTEVENAAFGSISQISSNNHSKLASNIRDNFKHFFLINAGKVSWQDNVIPVDP